MWTRFMQLYYLNEGRGILEIMPTLCVVFDRMLEKESKLHPTNLLLDERKTWNEIFREILFVCFYLYWILKFTDRWSLTSEW